MAGMAPVELAYVEDGNLILDNQALLFFMKNVGQGPMAIISIAGTFRSGKSFLMNFLLRYLHNKGWENRKWAGGDSTVITGGFPAIKGAKACTQGINAWPEIFSVPTSDGREISVIIVDTQGLYDDDTSPDVNAKLMSLSTLFSSHQILNLMRQIEERDLEHLQLCLEFSKAAGSIVIDESRKPFQKLTFLVRDWEHDYAFGDNTDGYFGEYLTKKSRSEVVQKVKEAIPAAFDQVSCTLLPHPGSNVTKLKDGKSLTNKDVDEDFMEHVVQFVESVLHPDNLAIKQSTGGGEQSSAGLVNLMAEVGNAFNSGKLPTAATLLESVARGANTKAREEAVKKYQEKMLEVCKSFLVILSDVKLNENHETSLGQAVSHFKSIANIGDEKSKAPYLQRMKEECENNLVRFKEENDLAKEIKLLHFEKLRITCYKQYEEAVQKIKHGVEDFEAAHEKSKSEAISKFDSETDEYKDLIPEIKNTAKGLRENIESRCVLEKAKLKSTELQFKLILDFERQLRKYENDYEENLKEDLARLKEKYAQNYKDQMKTEYDDTGYFEAEMDNQIKNAIRRNDNHRELLERKFEIIGKSFASAMDKEFQLIMSQAYITKEVFDRMTRRFLEKKVHGRDYKNLPKWGRHIVDDIIKKKSDVLKEENEGNREHRSVVISKWERLFRALTIISNEVKDAMGRAKGLFGHAKAVLSVTGLFVVSAVGGAVGGVIAVLDDAPSIDSIVEGIADGSVFYDC